VQAVAEGVGAAVAHEGRGEDALRVGLLRRRVLARAARLVVGAEQRAVARVERVGARGDDGAGQVARAIEVARRGARQVDLREQHLRGAARGAELLRLARRQVRDRERQVGTIAAE
jgi:hypothetical protein